MRVTLLRDLPRAAASPPVPPLGLGYVATSLRQAGHDVRILDLGNKRHLRRQRALEDALAAAPPDVVGVQVYSRELPGTRALIARIRAVLGDRATIVAGGPHPSAMPADVFAHLPGIDYAIAGEGERAMPQFARFVAGEVPAADVPGLVRRDGGAVRANEPVFPDDIDALGLPAWDLLQLDGYETEVMGGGFTKRRPAMTMLTSRGCPYRCAYCASALLCGHKLRLRNAAAVHEEMRLLREVHGFREIKILDDNFNADRRHVAALAEQCRRRPIDVSVSFACGLHLHTIDDALLDDLRDIGAYELMIAIESASPRVLELMNKRVDVSQVPAKVAAMRRHGFAVTSFFIIGYPGETPAEIESSVRLSLDLPLDRAHFNCFTPVPGTPIFDELRAAGRLADFDFAHVHFDSINYSFVDGLTASQLDRLRQRALLRFYLRPRILWHLLRTFRNWTAIKFLFRKAAEYFGFTRR